MPAPPTTRPSRGILRSNIGAVPAGAKALTVSGLALRSMPEVGLAEALPDAPSLPAHRAKLRPHRVPGPPLYPVERHDPSRRAHPIRTRQLDDAQPPRASTIARRPSGQNLQLRPSEAYHRDPPGIAGRPPLPRACTFLQRLQGPFL